MKQFFIFLLFIFIFFFSIFLGFIFRITWFVTYQKYLLERDFIYKPLIEAKGGGNTPQEAWLGYLTALEKGDIEEALEYVWPEERERFKEILKDIDTKEFIKSQGYKKLLKQLKKRVGMPEDEVLYTYLTDEEIKERIREYQKNPDIMWAYQQFLEASKNLNMPIESFEEYVGHSIPSVIFKFNPFSKKWLIKNPWF